MGVVFIGIIVLLFISVKHIKRRIKEMEKYLRNCQRFCGYIPAHPIFSMNKSEIEKLLSDWSVVYFSKAGCRRSAFGK